MKQKMNLAQISRTALWLGLIAFACFAAARAQTVVPHFDCTEPVYTNGVLTQLKAYYGFLHGTKRANSYFVSILKFQRYSLSSSL